MKVKESLICLLVIFHCSYAPPVTQDKSKEQDSEIKDDLVNNIIFLFIVTSPAIINDKINLMFVYWYNNNNKLL